MRDKLNKIISDLGYELYDTGSFTSSEDYPDQFFTCDNYSTEIDRSYDNDDYRCVWEYWLSFYTTGTNAQEVIDLVRNELKKNGWIVPHRGRDIDSGSQYHVGRELTIYLIEEV